MVIVLSPQSRLANASHYLDRIALLRCCRDFGESSWTDYITRRATFIVRAGPGRQSNKQVNVVKLMDSHCKYTLMIRHA